MAEGSRRLSRESWLLLTFCVLGAGLRFLTLNGQSFSFDEAVTVGTVLPQGLGATLAELSSTESTPPLYYLLAWGWTQPLGLSEVGVRSLSALVGTAVIPVVYLAARELGSRRAGLVAAGLTAVNPLLLVYSQEARAYSLLTLCAALSLWTFARALRDPARGRLAAWAAASSLALLTHYFAVFVVIPEVLWLLALAPRARALAASGAVAAVGAALLPLLLSQADGRTEWISGEPLATRARQVVSKFVVGEVDPTSNLVLAVVGLLAAAVGGLALARMSPRERSAPLVAGSVLAGAFLVPLLLDLGGLHYVLARNLLGALPVALVATGLVLSAQRVATLGTAVALALALGMFCVSVAGSLDPRLQRLDYRSAAQALRDAPGGTVVVVAYPGTAPLEVYLPGLRPLALGGAPVSDVHMVEPLRRRDAKRAARPTTPAPPAGFTLVSREDAPTFTRVRFRAARPRTARPAELGLLVENDASLGPPAVLRRP